VGERVVCGRQCHRFAVRVLAGWGDRMGRELPGREQEEHRQVMRLAQWLQKDPIACALPHGRIQTQGRKPSSRWAGCELPHPPF
jgi:hypothetical protein